MKKFGNFWVPDADARGRRNRTKLQRMYAEDEGTARPLLNAMEAIAAASPDWKPAQMVAIDGGANVGAYTRALAMRFARVISLEPAPDTFACLERNVFDWGLLPKVQTHMAALSDARTHISMGRGFGRLSITSRISGEGPIPALPIDSFGLTQVGFIKLDVEGFELNALKGAQETIRQSRPFVLMEVKPAEEERAAQPYAAERYLLEMGYELMTTMGINRLYRPAA